MAALTRDDLIDVLRRTTDTNWLDPILASPDSAAVVYAVADALARVSSQGQVACDNATISLSSSARGGTSTVTMTRDVNGSHGVIPKGYVFVDDRGLLAVVQGDVTVADPDYTVAVPVVTVRRTELVNTVDDPAFVVSPNNPPAADSGGTFALVGVNPAPAGYPIITSATFLAVTSSTPIVEGSTDWLAAVGYERGQLRQAGEEDNAFRLRVRNVPDAVSPVAIEQGAAAAASHVGLPAPLFLEPYNLGESQASRDRYQLGWFDTIYMSGILDNAGNADPSSPKTDFADDMGADLTNLKFRETVSLREARCYFRLQFDGPLADPDNVRTFWDFSFADDPVLGYPDIHDSPGLIAEVMAVWEEANRKRAAGVRFDAYMEV